MTDNEIIKALECCSDGWSCKSCAFDDEDGTVSECTSKLAKAALDLIQRQQERIERLKDNLDAVLSERADHSESIKEFADRAVIELTANYSDEYCHWIDDTIDSLVKEMVGEIDDR